MYSLDDYNYDLPQELIAQRPVSPRDRSRLLRLDKATGRIDHHRFDGIGDFLRPGDLLIVNDTEVVPVRLFGAKETGGRVEVLILDVAEAVTRNQDTQFFETDCLVRASRAPKKGSRLVFDPKLQAAVIEKRNGVSRLRFQCRGRLTDILSRIGHVPLPPYVNRVDDVEDKRTYQTVYACRQGAVAAPTAGLHFTDNLLDKLQQNGVQLARITLHVGYGTFRPVKVADIRQHHMYSEWFHIPDATASRIAGVKQDGGRVVAVGSTSVRTLEYAAAVDGAVRAGSGKSDLFIYPGYRFRVVDALVTNFHLPKSTLIMLVSAFAGRENVLRAYREAIAEGYRFYSYGDAMLIA
ncbi:S-adenosylmethionine:tRNA ribosyltransferase-isomerase (EC [Olavius algarvensis associated proteobacterium Delta 3]|nr:S-adenosylmethionine:tRNA ribosyltransferase-isomerase (EC [Olavius algarvensis associated proteobacterium Delta 3]CAB5157554.1 S-adenosylmethionine:tRNA ribosyltransferase-isomerase (EC [Olavius algarvensis associated proteobacterium Delta 3]